MLTKNKEFVEEFVKIRNLSNASKKAYQSSVKNYCEYQGLDIYQLLKEAETEEDKGIRLKHRTIKTRLINYRTHLIDANYSKNTIRQRMTHIISIYRDYEIDIPNLPKINQKQIKTFKPIMYDDLPTKSIIRQALWFADPLMKAIILLESSSGMGRTEALNLTISDFVTACGLNIKTMTVEEALNTLLHSNELIIPTFQLERQKTRKYYYTFCTPEAVQAILYYLTTRKNLNYNDKLLKLGQSIYYEKFNTLNELLGLDKLDNGFSKFRGHMLRKYQASHLRMGEHPLTLDEIDSLQGRSKNTTRESYFLDDPTTLKQRYIDNMDTLLINYNSNVIERTQIELDRTTEQVEKLTQLQEKRMELVNKLIIENPQDAYL